MAEYYTVDKRGKVAAAGMAKSPKAESKSESQETAERSCFPGGFSGLKTKPTVQTAVQK